MPGNVRPAVYCRREAAVFGSLGVPELMMIFVIALLLFGPKNLPKIGRTLGRALGEFRRASNDFKRTIEEEVAASEIREVEREIKGTVKPEQAEPEPAAGAQQTGGGEAGGE